MGRTRAPVLAPFAWAFLLACLAAPGGAWGQAAQPVTASANMASPCYADPSAAACADFQRADADWEADLASLCQAMPFMVGCSMAAQCKSGEAKGDHPYCSPASLVADICGPDNMGGMKGCEAWNGLCKPAASVVKQCSSPGAAPGVPTSYQTKEDIDGVCSSHSMDGCQDCTSPGRAFGACKELFNVYSKLCVSMPDMPTCVHWKQFCANNDAAQAFPKFCTQDAADGSSTSLPPMKMWFHQGTREMFMFKEWVPSSTGQYVGMCIAMTALAVFTQFLKAVRLRVEMRWAAAERQRRCDCPPVDLEAGDKCCQPSSSQPSSSRLDEAAAAKPPCCGGSGDAGDGGEAASSSASDSVPTSSRRKYWLRGAATSERALVVGGYQLITRAQAAKNLWRSCFTFVVIFLDYALMLVVMTFNVGIILAVCGGFAIGALLFGHAGEPGTLARHGQRSTPALRAPTMAPGPLSASAVGAGPEEELETVFVEGGGCCNGGGSGFGGGGHCGGQL